MQQYLDLLKKVLSSGYITSDRTGTGTFNLPSYQYMVEMYKDEDGVIHNFPLLTTKKMGFKNIFTELIWKLKGNTNIQFLLKNDCHIWTEWAFINYLEKLGVDVPMWADEKRSEYSSEWLSVKKAFEDKIIADDAFALEFGDLGKIYGHQFRNFNGVDQLQEALYEIQHNPSSRRIIINLWNASDLDKMALPPCPCFYQFIASEKGKLHLNLLQRSADCFLGVPYNTAQDALFLCMVAHVCDLEPSLFTHSFHNAHIYRNHKLQVLTQLERTPYPLPQIKINPKKKELLDIGFDDIHLLNYHHHPALKGAVSI